MIALLLAVALQWEIRADVPVDPGAEGGLEVAFPQLKPGTLLGTVRIGEPWTDARGSRVEPGTYAVRYALRPNDGNHMGVSTFRDFLVLVPVDEDPGPGAKPDYDALMALGKKTTGGRHPAVMALAPATESPATIRVGVLSIGVVPEFEGGP